MRAWRFHDFGDIANFQLEDVPMPSPGVGEVLIKLNVAALNPADRLLIEGRYPGAGRLPLTVGRDGAGHIEDANGAKRFQAGDPVLILRSDVGITRQGTLAEFVTAPEDVVVPVPNGWSLEDSAAASLVYLTAWKALVTQGQVQPGDTVLVTGASGGVGIAAVQLGTALGATVIALSRDPDKRARLVELGAHAALDDAAVDLADQVRQAAGGGIDIVIEHLGGPRLAEHIDMTNLNGRILVIGLLAGLMSEVNMGQVLFKQTRIEGVHVGQFAPAQAQEAWKGVVGTLDRVNARPVIDTVFPMSEVQEAFSRLAGGHLGKVLVDVTTPS